MQHASQMFYKLLCLFINKISIIFLCPVDVLVAFKAEYTTFM